MMNSEYSTLNVLASGDAVIVTCIVPILEFEHEEEVGWERDMDQVVAQLEGKLLIIDFSQVAVLSSSALQYLIKLLFLSRKENLAFGLCGLGDNIKRVLRITRLADMFIIGDCIEETRKLLKGRHEETSS